MKTSTVTSLFLSAASLAQAQVTYNPSTNQFDCATETGNYCAGNSLSTNIIIRCTNFIGQPGNCNDNLAGIDPVGVKSFAPCYQSSSSSGKAACSYNGVAYPDSGSSYPIPGASGGIMSGTAASAGSVVPPPNTSSAPYAMGNATVLPTGSGVSGMNTAGTVTGTATALFSLPSSPATFTGAAGMKATPILEAGKVLVGVAAGALMFL